MNIENTSFGLRSCDASDPAPVLAGVRVDGRLDGVLFELTLRQTYRNTSDKVLEVVYTFPLPVRTVLLGFASELNGERKIGAVVARPEAERRYEQALTEGDAPVMVEALADGLHAANIGNLKPGDELVLEVRFAQVLAFEQGRLRLAIPTTIAPRYGSAEAAGLQAQQVPHASLMAEYPLALSLFVSGGLAGAAIECPTHRMTREPVEGGVRLDLAAGAWLDRDVVIVVKPVEPRPSLVIQAHDAVTAAAPMVVMAALQAPFAPPREHIVLKLLVDCSGSMGGDSIASARIALRGVLAGLTEQDQVSISRFGSSVKHVVAPAACTPLNLRRLQVAVDAIDADLGGTEMASALEATFGLPLPPDIMGADVLLVTDGEIWQAAPMISAARASGHRVFAIGVGSSPAEAVLRSLAEATGGACEFATPGEALEAAAARMLVRIRQQPWHDVRIDWGCEPVWQTAVPNGVFGGDTVIAFAGLPVPVAAPTVRLLARDCDAVVTELARGEADAPCAADALPRIAAARRIATVDEGQALELAVAYQLMSRHTNCILVHERAEADKAIGQAVLHRVSSMLAAGWGATSMFAESLSMDDCAFGAPSAWPVAPASVDRQPRVSYSCRLDPDVPALSREHDDHRPPASLQAMAEAVFEHLSQGHDVQGLARHGESMALHADVRLAFDQVVAHGLTTGEAWLLLAHWVNQRPGETVDTRMAGVLRAHLDLMEAKVIAACTTLFDRLLGRYPNRTWPPTRVQRLQQALSAPSRQ